MPGRVEKRVIFSSREKKTRKKDTCKVLACYVEMHCDVKFILKWNKFRCTWIHTLSDYLIIHINKSISDRLTSFNLFIFCFCHRFIYKSRTVHVHNLILYCVVRHCDFISVVPFNGIMVWQLFVSKCSWDNENYCELAYVTVLYFFICFNVFQLQKYLILHKVNHMGDNWQWNKLSECFDLIERDSIKSNIYK